MYSYEENKMKRTKTHRERERSKKNDPNTQSKRHINHINFLPLSAIHLVSMHDTIKMIHTAINGVYIKYSTCHKLIGKIKFHLMCVSMNFYLFFLVFVSLSLSNNYAMVVNSCFCGQVVVGGFFSVFLSCSSLDFWSFRLSQNLLKYFVESVSLSLFAVYAYV